MSESGSPRESIPERREDEPPPLPPESPRARRARRAGAARATAGTAISNAFSAWMQNLIPFSLLSLLIHVPYFLFGWWTFSATLTDEQLAWVGLVDWLGPLLLQLILTASVVFGVVNRLRGVREGMGRAFVQGLRRTGPALLVSLVIALPTVAAVLLAVLTLESAFLLLLIVQVVVYVVFFVAIPAVVVERPGALGLGALGRSLFLTRGRRGTVFGAILLQVLVVIGLSIPVGLFGFALFPDEYHEGAPLTFRAFLFTAGFQALILPFNACVPAVIYFLLRREKEGYEVENVAEVF